LAKHYFVIVSNYDNRHLFLNKFCNF